MATQCFRFVSVTAILTLAPLFYAACLAPVVDGPARSDAPKPASDTIDYAAIVNAPDRDAEDKAKDASRKPAELLAFARVRPGMKVAELMAGAGYTTELLARAVGPRGVVLAQNNKRYLGFIGKAWTERLKKPINKTIQRLDRELETGLDQDASLDLIVFVLIYHDLVSIGTDRAKLNKLLLGALKPGGHLVVVDASSAVGTGVTVAGTLHRIEEAVVVKEITEAGFRQVAAGQFLRVASDPRTTNGSPMATTAAQREQVDKFVLKFVKP